ncbi:hypothetical protein, conserved [Leishmania tarentolae]|uniref:Uncharacterized protein n=1 Tax=Leishmania tarentolae TaxID=5689 RepID=A0A640KCJ0_LEITA|nr:hypothetical protein, conserved [Leishmania tarentolae]
MSDVLGYLNGVLHRVSATFMPTEMNDVASFLRGDAWVVATASSASSQQTAVTSSTAASDLPREVKQPITVSYPHGAIRWGHFIPLGIAGATLLSAATSGSRAVLLNFFESNGFEQVFTVSLVPTEQQQQSHAHLSTPGTMEVSGTSVDAALSPHGHRHADHWSMQRLLSFSPSDIGGTTNFRKRARSSATSSAFVDVSLDSRYSTTTEAARHGCMATVRRWFEGVEAKALLDTDELGKGENEDASFSAAGGAQRKRKGQLRRLLIIVRCCTDNRVTFSTRGGTTGAAQASSSGTGRRHRRGEDPLYLLLHDLAALTTLYEVRLSPTGCAARPAVLLLPEDDSYGGSMLKQQLQDEVGHRYWVELFLQSESASGGSSACHGEAGTTDTTGRGVRKGGGWRATLIGCSSGSNGSPGGLGGVLRQRQHEQAETPLERGCRLAAQWGVLDLPVTMPSEHQSTGREAVMHSVETSFPPVGVPGGARVSEQGTSSVASGLPAESCVSTQQREEALRRHACCFFLRPSNAPLCVFLMEALRRFPVLVRPAVLQHWQSTWTSRHSLMDVLLVFHTAICPFMLSSSFAGDTVACPAPNSPSERKEGPAFPASTMLQDTTDLLDALLDAAFTLTEERDAERPLSANDFVIEHATLFLLFYEALVHQREGRLRRIPGVVRVLTNLSDRHARATTDSCAAGGTSACSPRGRASTDEKIHHAVRHHLPFAPLNLFYQRVAQLAAPACKGHDSRREVQPYPMDAIVLPIRRMSLAPQLQHSTLLALLPLGESLLELQGVVERVWREELPTRWQRVVAPVGTRDDHRRALSSPVTLRAINDGADASAPTQLSAENFYHPLVPHAVRVLHLLTAHALRAPTEAAKQVPIVQLQIISQLSDAQLLRVLKELQVTGLASTNLKTKSARTLLDTM